MKSNIPFVRFLKQTLKNCQRIRSKRKAEESKQLNRPKYDNKYYRETEKIIRKYLYDRLSPYGIIGCENHIRCLISQAKIIKRLGKAAKKQGKILFLKVAFCMWYSFRNTFDWRAIPFNDFNFEEYESKIGTLGMKYEWMKDPF